ncbi:MAG: hypothetical protein H6608_07645 [Flavobacteriales bacterium]|nr:hypothetical protein [Bacteroidota bacterium]MCB9240988.1 hypothetical protein [Flavobacteriales bacterium]
MSSIPVEDVSLEMEDWRDKLILNYISSTDQPLIHLSFMDSSITVEWIFDQVYETDTAIYFIYQIGHEEIDSVELNQRFVTDGWVYVDTTTRELFEFELTSEKLLRWQVK